MGDDVVYSRASRVAAACLGWCCVSRECLGTQSPAHYTTSHDARDAWHGGVGAALAVLSSAETSEIPLVKTYPHVVSVGIVAIRRFSLCLSGT